MKKYIFTALLMFAVFFFGRQEVFAAEITQKNIDEALEFCKAYPVSLFYEGEAIEFAAKDTPPVIVTPTGESNGRTLIPSRALFEKMGGEVGWNDDTKEVSVSLNGTVIRLQIGSDTAWVGNEQYKLDVPALIIDHDGDYYGSTMIPVRFVAEKLMCDVKWDDSSRQVRVSKTVATPGVVDGGEVVAVTPDGGSDGEVAVVIPDAGSGAGEQPNEAPEWLSGGGVVSVPGGTGTSQQTDTDNINAGENADKTTDASNEPGTVPGWLLSQNAGNEPEPGEVSRGGYRIGDTVGGLFPIYEFTPLPAAGYGASQKLIVLDFGHGGRDCGAIGHEKKADQIYEKDLNLPIGLKMMEYLRGAGMNVKALKTKDILMDKYERATKANEMGADFFVSVHNNSSYSSKPKGTEVLYYAKVNEEGLGETALYGITSGFVAQNVQREMVKALGTEDRGLNHDPEIAVLNKTSMPAIVIEGAFLSNEEDFKKMKSDEFIERYAYAAAKGIIEAFNKRF